MAHTTRHDIDGFLALHRIAIVGVSRDEKSYSRMLLRAFTDRGYDVVPVNPSAPEIEGRQCFSTIAQVQPPVEGVLVLTKASEYPLIAAECASAGVKHLWFRFPAPPVDGATVVQDECPFMWLPDREWYHSLHRALRGLVGALPR